MPDTSAVGLAGVCASRPRLYLWTGSKKFTHARASFVPHAAVNTHDQQHCIVSDSKDDQAALRAVSTARQCQRVVHLVDLLLLPFAPQRCGGGLQRGPSQPTAAHASTWSAAVAPCDARHSRRRSHRDQPLKLWLRLRLWCWCWWCWWCCWCWCWCSCWCCSFGRTSTERDVKITTCRLAGLVGMHPVASHLGVKLWRLWQLLIIESPKKNLNKT